MSVPNNNKMNRLKVIITACLLTASMLGLAQEKQINQTVKLIAVVNQANWCAVCKANGQRFVELINSYSSQGVSVYFNDLTNDTTTQASKKILEKEGLYDAVITIPRKGMGKMLKACRIIDDKKQTTLASGIVTFISPVSHRQLKQESIAATDIELKKIIDNLLAN
jgi:hypothetical protein